MSESNNPTLAGRTIHGITMKRDSDGSFAVTMPDRWFAASPANDAEDNIEGEVCMLLEHLWNAADLAGRDSEADAVRLYPRAMGYARTLAMDLHRLHFAQSAPMWQPYDDLLGLLTQIDNMAAGLALRVAHSREQDAPLVANTPGCNCPGEGKHEAHLHAPNCPYRNPLAGREAPTVEGLEELITKREQAYVYYSKHGGGDAHGAEAWQSARKATRSYAERLARSPGAAEPNGGETWNPEPPCWLVEKRKNGATIGFLGYSLGCFEWFATTDKATRFARRQDANGVAECFEFDDVIVAEHIWG